MSSLRFLQEQKGHQEGLETSRARGRHGVMGAAHASMLLAWATHFQGAEGAVKVINSGCIYEMNEQHRFREVFM